MAAAMLRKGSRWSTSSGRRPVMPTSPAHGSRSRIASTQIVAKGRNPVPKEIRFTTWTLRYNRMFWLTVDADGGALGACPRQRDARREQHPAHDRERDGAAPGVRRRPRAVRTGDEGQRPHRRRIGSAAGRRVRSLPVRRARQGGRRLEGRRTAARHAPKKHGPAGPIDDAFMDGFMFVRPTGTAVVARRWGSGRRSRRTTPSANGCTSSAASRVCRQDSDVTAADIAAHNLVLFGDPSSNAVYKRIADRLPIRGRPTAWSCGGETFLEGSRAGVHLPEPAEPDKYMVDQQRLHVPRSVEQRHAVARSSRTGPSSTSPKAGEQLPVSAALRRVAGILRRKLDTEGAVQALTGDGTWHMAHGTWHMAKRAHDKGQIGHGETGFEHLLSSIYHLPFAI